MCFICDVRCKILDVFYFCAKFNKKSSNLICFVVSILQLLYDTKSNLITFDIQNQ